MFKLTKALLVEYITALSGKEVKKRRRFFEAYKKTEIRYFGKCRMLTKSKIQICMPGT